MASNLAKVKVARPDPPKGLGPAGQHLWNAILDGLPDGFMLAPREEALLADAARMSDTIAALDEVVAEEGVVALGVGKQRVAHPCLVEARLMRTSLHALLGKIGLDEPTAYRADAARRSESAKKAAQARWARRAS